MPTQPDAVRVNLEFYRKHAKALLKAALSGDTAAYQRLIQHVPKLSEAGSPSPALHDAQFAVAREQGFPSWPRMKAFITQSQLDFQALANTFIEAALSDRPQAEALLAAQPELAQAGLYAALVLGDFEAVSSAIEESESLALSKGGPRNWEPLLYVCFSRFGNPQSTRASSVVQTAELLLRHGADPNSSYSDSRWPDNPLSCLYGASGVNNNPKLALVLLHAGANPNDSESLYHSTEHADLACLKLLLAHGATPHKTNALKHMLDREDLEGVNLLLNSGADPNERNHRGETSLQWAIRCGRSARIIAVLLDHGAELDARRYDGRTAYAMAVQSGDAEVSALLKARGANTELTTLDRIIDAHIAADLPPTEIQKIPASAESNRLLPDLASSHRTSGVRALLNAGMPIHARGELGATALHWACWKGYPDIVKLLLEHGASLTIEDETYKGTPPGWFGHGIKNCNENGGDYPEVARLLISAGAKIPTVDLPTGSPDVDAVLREHGLI